MTEDLPATPAGVDRSQWLRVRAVALYAVSAALWILGSDRLLDLLLHDRATIIQAGTYKGWLFVAVTSGLLYWLMRRPVAAAPALPAAPAGSLRPWLLPFGGIVALVAILAAAAIAGSYRHYHDKGAGRLQAVADLRGGQVAQWLDERIAQARFAGESPLGERFLRWREAGDPATRDRLATGLSSLLKASRSRAVLIVDDRGRMIGPSGEISGSLPAELGPAVTNAMQGNEVRFTDPQDGGPGMDSRFDIIAPLALSGSSARAAIVLRLDPRDFLLPTLNRRLLPDHSATSTLIGRDGRALLNATSSAIRPGAHFAMPDASSPAFTGRDMYGEAVLSVVRPVAQTDWLLVTSIRSAEIYADARRDALWIAAVGAMAVFACAIGMFLLRERLALQLKGVETRQQAERLHALQLLQSIADSSTDLIYAKDKAGRFLLFNRESGRASGVSCELVIGKCGHDIFPAAQAEQMKASDQRVMETGRPYSYENEIDTVDGPRTFLSTKGLLRGPDGEPTGVFGISRDITARRRAEQALRESAELVQAVEDSVLDHMAVLDADGTIIAVNAAWREFGAAPATPHCRGLPRSGVGVNCLDAPSGPESAGAVSACEGIAAVLAGREPVFTFEYCCGCDEPRQRWFVMKVTPLKIARGGAVVVHSNITELKRNGALQEEIECRSRLEQALQDTIADLEAFSYSVSHDLRSPLSAINAFAVSLLESEAPALSKEGLHRLDRIIAGSRRMNQMIDDILLCSRAERTEMRLQTVNLGAMVGEVVAELRHAWPTTRIAIGPLPAVHADATMLRQVIANLIGNALKFSGGRPDAQVEIEARSVDEVTEILVRDNGAGFDMAYGYKLFGLFQRLHSDSEFPGTGVGLAIVKRLVSRHGGCVRAESVPGGWTTFCFTLGGVTRDATGARAGAARQLSAQWH